MPIKNRFISLVLDLWAEIEVWASSTADIAPFYIKDFERAKRAGLGKLVNIVEIREIDDTNSIDVSESSTCKVH